MFIFDPFATADKTTLFEVLSGCTRPAALPPAPGLGRGNGR
jgi:hypothetical protein